MYIVFSGECEVYKTRKDFLPQFQRNENDEILELDSALPRLSQKEDSVTYSPKKMG
jgi:hypothetical protein